MKNKQTKQIFYYMLLLGVIIAPCFMYVPPIYGCTVDSITLYTGSSSTSLTASALRIPQGSNAYYYARCTVTNPNQYRILWEFDIDGNGVYEYLTITYYDSSGYYLKAPSSTASRYFSNSGTFNARVRCCLIDASGSAVSSYVSDTCDIYVVGVGSVSAGGQISIPGNIKTIYVAKGSDGATIPVTAAPNPSGAWPSGRPTWKFGEDTQTTTGSSISFPIHTAGTTTVTATCGTSSCAINIVVVEIVSLQSDKEVVGVGEDVDFSVETSPIDYYNDINWSGGGSPATQSGGQIFTTSWNTPGTKTVTASCGSSSISKEVEVIEGLTVVPRNAYVGVEGQKSFAAWTFENGSAIDVTSSSTFTTSKGDLPLQKNLWVSTGSGNAPRL